MHRSVFIDLLTYSDLETLKQKRLGHSTTSGTSSTSNSSTSSTSTNSLSHQKRYLILTYSGEFDRVHYPLPLAFEVTPNIAALKRTIIRLRKQRSAGEGVGRADGGKNDEATDDKIDSASRHIVTQLRKENTELRHCLRQAESRYAKLQETSRSASVNNSFAQSGR